MTKNVSIHEILSKLASKIVGMPRTTRRKAKYSKKRWVVLVLCLMAAIVMVIVPLQWLYQKISLHWGTDTADIILTFVVAFLAILVISGTFLGRYIDSTIQKHNSNSQNPDLPCWAICTAQMRCYETEPKPPLTLMVSNESSKEIGKKPQIPEKATRPGRKPQFNVRDWAKVALIWEQRDPTFDLFTLEDVISQTLGKAADGGPIMSAKTYRSTWRLRAIRYINENGLVKKPLPEEEKQ